MLNGLHDIAPNGNTEDLKKIVSFCYAILSSDKSTITLPDFPADSLIQLGKIINHNPNMSVHNAIYRLYPYKSFLPKEGVQGVLTLLKSLNITIPPDELSQKIIDVESLDVKTNEEDTHKSLGT